MRLYFQIMWIIVLSSATQIVFASSHSSCKDLRRAARQSRVKRLLFKGVKENNDIQYFNDDSSCRSSSAKTEEDACVRPKMNDRNTKSHGTGIAMQAALEAKQANDDMANAVRIASDRIKLEYADKAAAAAKAAEAVLAGKRQVLEQLEMEVREAEIIVQEETQELCTAEANSQLALKAHQQSKEVLKLTVAGLKLAREYFDSTEQVSVACQQSMTDKTSLLDAAQKRVEMLLRQLSDSRSDYHKTKKSAYKALCAANEAKARIDHPQH